MKAHFDERVLSGIDVGFIKACQGHTPCHLGGGAALSGAWLAHRLSRDIDLFCHERELHRQLVSDLDDIAGSVGLTCTLVRDGGSHVRAVLNGPLGSKELDVVFEPGRDLEPPPAPVDGIVLQSLADIRASKLTCLLSRSEPRDLVDLLFLEKAGFPPEADLGNALRKDAGIDPGVLAWLLRDFPTRPLPTMLLPLTEQELTDFRDDLAVRFKAVTLPGAPSGP